MTSGGADLLKREQVLLTLDRRQVPVTFDLRAWALLEKHYGAPTLYEAIQRVAQLLHPRVIKAEDAIYIAWAATRHMGDGAPDMDEISTARVAELLSADSPLVAALQVSLPKDVQPLRKQNEAASGTGRLRSMWSRWSGGARRLLFGA